MKKILVVLSFVIFCQSAMAQESKTTDFYSKIGLYDLSTIWTADSIWADGEEWIKRSEPMGFIGEDFQRFYIHFISVIKKQQSPNEYLVYGKTRVKNTICTFQGEIKIKEAKLYVDNEFPEFQQGYATCDVLFYEDSKQSSTGLISGQCTTYFLFNEHGEFMYDALFFVADGFTNNQFSCKWTSYKNKGSKTCNWGDGRIPDSKDLDQCVSEFCVNEKYIKNGWENFVKAYQQWGVKESESPESVKAREIENIKWWE